MNEGLPKDHWKRKLCLGNEPPVWFDGALFLVGSFGVIIFLSAVYTLMRTILFSNVIEESGDVRGLAFIIFGLIGLPFVIWRAIVTQGNLNRSKDRDYADLFTKAVEQLGATREVKRYDEKLAREVTEIEYNTEVRLGSIYALERISQDSERDHIAVMETLAAYIRNNVNKAQHDLYTTRIARFQDGTTDATSVKRLNPEVRAGLVVIDRRSNERRMFERNVEFRLNFRFSLFVGCDLSDTDFSFGDLREATISKSLMFNTDMSFSIHALV